jgi:uncharacterized protein (DUF488 family)
MLSSMAPLTIWTIGHSNQSFEAFARLLLDEEIDVVVDVRSFPYSRFAPHFNREDLAPALRERGIRYGYLGDELGGRPVKDEHYDGEGHALYGLMAQEPAFRQALDRVVAGARDHRVALMCSEAEPRSCHRRLLVGKVLAEQGVELRHILRNGSVEVERDVSIGEQEQGALFGTEEAVWRSTQSVSRRRRLSASSAA